MSNSDVHDLMNRAGLLVWLLILMMQGRLLQSSSIERIFKLKCLDEISFFHLPFQMNELPQPKFLNKTLREMNIGTYENVVTVCITTYSYTCNKWASLWENRSSGFQTWSDTNRPVQSEKMARGLKFWIKEVKGLYYPCSKNKGADQLCGYRTADLRVCFRLCKKPFFS